MQFVQDGQRQADQGMVSGDRAGRPQANLLDGYLHALGLL